MRFWVCIFVLLFVHNQFSRADKIINNDSLYTEKYIRDIYISNPKRALQLLDEAETRKAFPLRLINELRSLSYRNMYMNKLAFMYARKSYLLDSISQREPKHMLKMTVYLAELSSIMSKYNESMHYALSGIMQAQKLKDREAEARLLFCIGENNWRLSLKDEAYNYFGRTIELLRGSKDMREMMLLSYYYGAEMGFLMTDSRIDEALALAYEREKLLKKLEKVPEVPEGYIDGQYSYLYANLAYISYLEKKYAQAEGYYQKYLAIKESHTPDGKMYSIPYLILSKQYETVIDNCKDFKELLRTQRDTLNAQYLTILNKEVQAYLGLNRYKEAAEIRETIIAITDSINSTDRKNAALELNAMYGASEKEEYIAEQASQLKIRNVSLCFLACIVVLTLFILWRLWRFNHIIEYKNRMLAKLINEKFANKKDGNQLLEVYEEQEVSSELEPEIYYGFNLGAEYKGLGVLAQFQGVANYSQVLDTRSVYRQMINNNTISRYYWENRWSENNPNGTLPRLTTLGSANNYNNNSLWVTDASFLKLRTLEVYYQLPDKWLRRQNVVKSVKLYVRGHDLLCLDGIDIADPEALGVTHPAMKQYTFGFNLQF